MVIEVLLEGERVLEGTVRRGVELPEGGQEVRKTAELFQSVDESE